MKLFDQTLECIAIKSICASPSENVRALLLGSLDATHFHYEPCISSLRRLKKMASSRAKILSWSELLSDPALDEEMRDLLREEKAAVCKSQNRATSLIERLEEYRKIRGLYFMAKGITESLLKSSVDLETLLNETTNTLSGLRLSRDDSQIMFSLGKDGDAVHLAKTVLSEDVEVLFKTGFAEVDEKQGGLFCEGVLLLAATTSGGKSTLLQNLLYNIYTLNKVSVCNASLEMNEKKLARRHLSMLSKIPFWKYTKKALSREEKKTSFRKWKELHAFGEEHDITYSFVCPKRGISMTDLLTLVKPYNFKVVGVDYAGLLSGMDGDNQWRALSGALREAKIYSEETGSLVIVLAQLDDADDRIRYSKGMAEHADGVWTWNYAKAEVRETKRLPIKQKKGRDSDLLSFELKEEFEIMTISNLEGAGTTTQATEDIDLNEEVDFEAGAK